MIPEENVVPEDSIKDNLSNQDNIEQQDVVVDKDVSLSIDIKDKKNFKIDDYLSSEILDVKLYAPTDTLVTDDINLNDINLDETIYDNINSNIQEKQVVEGTVVGINDKGVIIDIGFKSEGIIDRSEFNTLPEINDKVDVFLITFENRRGEMLLSKEKADFAKRWEQLRNAFSDETVINGTITKRIKGGFVVDLGVVNAFLPGSQLEAKSITDYDQYLNNEYEFKIVKFNEFRQNIVVSRKATLSVENDEQRKELLSSIKVGNVYEGLIKNITDFGAFIDLGGIDGLLHITDITWGRINHPTEKVSIGDKIDVKVIDFDEKTTRISLGTKQLTPDPWVGAADKYEEESTVQGKVVNLMNYGMFIEIEEGVEGLVHISEMSWTKHIKHPSDMFKMGDKIESKILSINVDDKKISLGIKQLGDNPWDKIEDKYNVDDILTCKIKNIVGNGTFIKIDDNIEGFLHNNDLSWTRKYKSIKDLTSKQDIDVKVLEVSSKDKRIVLSHKHLIEDPWSDVDNLVNLNTDIEAKILFVLDKNIICLFNDCFEGIIQINDNNKDNLKDCKENDMIVIQVKEINIEKRKLFLDFVNSNKPESNNDETDNDNEVDNLDATSKDTNIKEQINDKDSE